MVNSAVDNSAGVMRYMQQMHTVMSLIYPSLNNQEIKDAIDYSVKKRFVDTKCKIVNNYNKKEHEMLLSEFTNYIASQQPICTPSGVMFMRHGTVPNPLIEMIRGFMEMRGVHKAEMFKYPKGSEMFVKYNLLQLLDKIDCNGIYGVLGQCQAMFYNIFVAESITTTGRELISTATMFFESFLSNNVKFASLEEVVWFIDNVVSERKERRYRDCDILDHNISKEECFNKIVLTIGDYKQGLIKWLPDEMDLQIIWDIINRLDQEDINRLYYKNNLYEFMDNASMTNALLILLEKLDQPFMDPNEPPKEIKVEIDTLVDILKEFVYFKYQYMDKVDRCDNMIKNIAGISDTDSAIISLEAWFRFGLEKCKGHKFKILNEIDNPVLGETKPIEEDYEDYDFINDDIVIRKRLVNPNKQTGSDNLRYSLVNIMAYIVGALVNDYMVEYTKANHSYGEDRKCLIYMKNEFLMKRALLTEGMKNYASKQELQEGHKVPEEESMDIKGLQIRKVTLNKSIQSALSKILYEEILDTDVIDQVRIIKRLAILDKKIFRSLNNGEKEFYKPVNVKSMDHYDDPMGIQGIKAAVIWNAIKDDGLEGFDLTARNSMDIVKVVVNEETVEKIKDTYPETYEKIKNVLKDTSIFKGKATSKGNEFTSLAMPLDVGVPKWVVEFIDYTTIINDNIGNFPLKSVNIQTNGNNNIPYSNIMSI